MVSNMILTLQHLVRPTITGPVQDPPAVLSLDNPLCMKCLVVTHAHRKVHSINKNLNYKPSDLIHVKYLINLEHRKLNR